MFDHSRSIDVWRNKLVDQLNPMHWIWFVAFDYSKNIMEKNQYTKFIKWQIKNSCDNKKYLTWRKPGNFDFNGKPNCSTVIPTVEIFAGRFFPWIAASKVVFPRPYIIYNTNVKYIITYSQQDLFQLKNSIKLVEVILEKF